MVGLLRRNDPNQRQSRPGPRMTRIPANKNHPGSADVLVGHAPQGVWPPPSRFDAGEMHHSPRNGAFAPEIWADTEVSPPNIRVSSFRFASFAPAHVALRAAFGRLPSQHPLACVPLSRLPLPLRVPAPLREVLERRCEQASNSSSEGLFFVFRVSKKYKK